MDQRNSAGMHSPLPTDHFFELNTSTPAHGCTHGAAGKRWPRAARSRLAAVEGILTGAHSPSKQTS